MISGEQFRGTCSGSFTPFADGSEQFLGLFRLAQGPMFNVWIWQTEQFRGGLGGVIAQDCNREFFRRYLYKFNKKLNLCQGAFAPFF